MRLFPVLTACFLLFAAVCTAQTRPAPLIPKDETNENERKNKLFVFVGEKIEENTLPFESGDLDNGYRLRYRVLVPVYGHYAGDTISFDAYDHYGRPAFLHHQHVLLFLSEYEGRYYHEKYQFFDVYKTTNGRWASPYARDDYEHAYNKSTRVKPEKIPFATEIIYPLKTRGRDMTWHYPEPYFKITGDSAIAVYGNYVEDLFRLKKEGVLTARNLFGDRQAKERELKAAEQENNEN